MSETPDYVLRNRAAWNEYAADYFEPGRKNWLEEPSWGIWGLPESELRLLPDDLAGKETLELGCGTGYVSAWLARRGARPIGLDNSPVQLANARKFQQEFGLEFPLVHGIAEQLPFPDNRFDFAISEYGAAIWSDPYLWIPEAARVLRPGAELVFLGNHPLLTMCAPDSEGDPATPLLLRDYFGPRRLEWTGEQSVEFWLPQGEWIRLFRANGFEILDLIELRVPEGATTRYPYVTAEWAHRWPSEQVWKVRLQGR